ncbi:hypothetical protein, partial [Xenorhabdus cabanillasii]
SRYGLLPYIRRHKGLICPRHDVIRTLFPSQPSSVCDYLGFTQVIAGPIAVFSSVFANSVKASVSIHLIQLMDSKSFFHIIINLICQNTPDNSGQLVS